MIDVDNRLDLGWDEGKGNIKYNFQIHVGMGSLSVSEKKTTRQDRIHRGEAGVIWVRLNLRCL